MPGRTGPREERCGRGMNKERRKVWVRDEEEGKMAWRHHRSSAPKYRDQSRILRSMYIIWSKKEGCFARTANS